MGKIVFHRWDWKSIALNYWIHQEQFREFIINAQRQLPIVVREAPQNQLTEKACLKMLKSQSEFSQKN
jgi:hypothetical protein